MARLTREDVYILFDKYLRDKEMTQKQYAVLNGVSPQTITNIYTGKWAVPEFVLADLGLVEQATSYVRVKK